MTVPKRQDVDAAAVEMLIDRDGMPTTVRLADARTVTVWNIAWGYDLGDEYAHVTTNCSPFIDGQPSDFFYTNDIAEIIEPRDGTVLFSSNH